MLALFNVICGRHCPSLLTICCPDLYKKKSLWVSFPDCLLITSVSSGYNLPQTYAHLVACVTALARLLFCTIARHATGILAVHLLLRRLDVMLCRLLLCLPIRSQPLLINVMILLNQHRPGVHRFECNLRNHR